MSAVLARFPRTDNHEDDASSEFDSEELDVSDAPPLSPPTIRIKLGTIVEEDGSKVDSSLLSSGAVAGPSAGASAHMGRARASGGHDDQIRNAKKRRVSFEPAEPRALAPLAMSTGSNSPPPSVDDEQVSSQQGFAASQAYLSSVRDAPFVD